jgi:hypothetical protein
VTRRLRVLLAVVLAMFLLGLAGCGRLGVNGSTSPAAGPDTTDNPFIPKDQDLSNCVGTLEQPNCGSSNKSDARLYVTFAVLMTGMALIGWRIAVAIRNRDRELTEHLPKHTF